MAGRRARKQQKEYRKRPEVIEKMRRRYNPDFYELTDVIKEIENGESPDITERLSGNPYYHLFICLGSFSYSIKHTRIMRELGEELLGKSTVSRLTSLRKEGLVSREDKRYSLTPRGREVYDYLRPMASSII